MARVAPRKTRSLAVQQHSPWQTWLLRGLALVLLLGGSYAAFEYGRYRAGYDREAAAAAVRELQTALAASEQDNRDLRERLAVLEQAREVDQQARTEVRGNLSDLQDEILELREELAFYRGIVSPEDSASGLKIQDFKVSSGVQDGLYRYKLVLIQAIKHDRRATGSVNMTLYGVRAGAPVQLSLQSVSPEHTDTLDFSFRYFQDFEGDIVLPAGFTPGRIEIVVQPSGRGAETIRKSYEWPALTG